MNLSKDCSNDVGVKKFIHPARSPCFGQWLPQTRTPIQHFRAVLTTTLRPLYPPSM